MRVLACAALTFAVLGAGTATAGSPPGTFAGCPTHLQPLPGSAASYAASVGPAVLRFVHGPFARKSAHPATLADARVRLALRVDHWLPSGFIRSECGRTVWHRSLLVDVYFPRLDKPHNPVGHCNACAHVSFFVSRTAAGWTVWGDY